MYNMNGVEKIEKERKEVRDERNGEAEEVTKKRGGRKLIRSAQLNSVKV